MKSTVVKINGKDIIILEKKNKEIQQLISRYTKELENLPLGNSIITLLNSLDDFLNEKMLEIIPEITQNDLDEAYPSEIAEAIDAFVTLNFPLARRFGGPMLSMMSAGLQTMKK